MARIVIPARADVVIREDVIESLSDPKPNAFFDHKSGTLRVYHGATFGNHFTTIIPLHANCIGIFAPYVTHFAVEYPNSSTFVQNGLHAGQTPVQSAGPTPTTVPQTHDESASYMESSASSLSQNNHSCRSKNASSSSVVSINKVLKLDGDKNNSTGSDAKKTGASNNAKLEVSADKNSSSSSEKRVRFHAKVSDSTLDEGYMSNPGSETSANYPRNMLSACNTGQKTSANKANGTASSMRWDKTANDTPLHAEWGTSTSNLNDTASSTGWDTSANDTTWHAEWETSTSNPNDTAPSTGWDTSANDTTWHAGWETSASNLNDATWNAGCDASADNSNSGTGDASWEAPDHDRHNTSSTSKWDTTTLRDPNNTIPEAGQKTGFNASNRSVAIENPVTQSTLSPLPTWSWTTPEASHASKGW